MPEFIAYTLMGIAGIGMLYELIVYLYTEEKEERERNGGRQHDSLPF